MLRHFAIAAIVASASPAFAQPCKVTRTDAALASVTTAEISKDGKSAQKILLVTGPIESALTFEATAKGYSTKTKDKAALYIYRYGASLPDKDWREPQSIKADEGGFGVDWPRLMKDGKPVRLRVVVKMGNFGREDKPDFPAKGDRDGVQMVLSDDFAPPPGRVVVGIGATKDATANTRANWSNIIPYRNPMTLLLYDLDSKGLVASAAFTWPTNEATLARYVADINALRKAYADKACAKR